ncbi:hypothetical protein HELRODRAFT_159622 [Helobdella robusta]|uniref:Uncharacterized protein n=1 Tax=Helobdella robusta TaxID=6412 RepID=T1EP91_HELRO|nr:hypothetical protein HELRODRAFT_159622 [Helobdella robusta]ESO13026.1 hypothetical protein HELRODRAFT_159622 [Helobdella robusta]
MLSGQKRKNICLQFIFSKSAQNIKNDDDEEGVVNVLEVNDESYDEAYEKPRLYNVEKSVNAMNQCQRYCHFARFFITSDNNHDDEDDEVNTANKKTANNDNEMVNNENHFEEEVYESLERDQTPPCLLPRDDQSNAQKYAIKRVLKLLKMERSRNEFIKRKLSLTQLAEQFRRIMATVYWDKSVASWLHGKLVSTLSEELLVIYIEILQLLKSQLPNLIDTMIGDNLKHLNETAAEGFNLLLSSPWQPVDVINPTKRIIDQPGISQPILIKIENIEDSGSAALKRRWRFWDSYLSDTARICNVHCVEGSHAIACHASINHIRNHMQRLMHKVVNRIKKVSSKVLVDGVICLNYSFDRSGDNHLIDITTPTLYIIGQRSKYNCPVERIESYRQKYDVVTGLVLVGGGDDDLEVDFPRLKYYEITQTIVDKCILEKVKDFIACVLHSKNRSLND